MAKEFKPKVSKAGDPKENARMKSDVSIKEIILKS